MSDRQRFGWLAILAIVLIVGVYWAFVVRPGECTDKGGHWRWVGNGGICLTDDGRVMP